MRWWLRHALLMPLRRDVKMRALLGEVPGQAWDGVAAHD